MYESIIFEVLSFYLLLNTNKGTYVTSSSSFFLSSFCLWKLFLMELSACYPLGPLRFACNVLDADQVGDRGGPRRKLEWRLGYGWYRRIEVAWKFWRCLRFRILRGSCNELALIARALLRSSKLWWHLSHRCSLSRWAWRLISVEDLVWRSIHLPILCCRQSGGWRIHRWCACSHPSRGFRGGSNVPTLCQSRRLSILLSPSELRDSTQEYAEPPKWAIGAQLQSPWKVHWHKDA